MPAIKRILDGLVITTSLPPVFVNGVWECGDQRFTDIKGTEYEALPTYPVLMPMQFYMAFKPNEREAIKASTDAMVMEFWDAYQRAERTATQINPNLASIGDALLYLASKGLIAGDRIPAIKNGISQ